MEELLAAIMENPIFKEVLTRVEQDAIQAAENAAVRLVASIFHKRGVDPEFVSKSDAVFSQLHAAKTKEEQDNAQMALRDLMAQ